MNADDLNFAYKVRHALNEHLDNLPPATVDRLAAARKQALQRRKPESGLLVAGRRRAGPAAGLLSFSWAGRMGVVLPLVALVAGLSGIYQYEEQQRIAEIAELDAAVLSDELPLTAYLDQGFEAYLAQRGHQ
jgi:hypothetical protein